MSLECGGLAEVIGACWGTRRRQNSTSALTALPPWPVSYYRGLCLAPGAKALVVNCPYPSPSLSPYFPLCCPLLFSLRSVLGVYSIVALKFLTSGFKCFVQIFDSDISSPARICLLTSKFNVTKCTLDFSLILLLPNLPFSAWAIYSSNYKAWGPSLISLFIIHQEILLALPLKIFLLCPRPLHGYHSVPNLCYLHFNILLTGSLQSFLHPIQFCPLYLPIVLLRAFLSLCSPGQSWNMLVSLLLRTFALICPSVWMFFSLSTGIALLLP